MASPAIATTGASRPLVGASTAGGVSAKERELLKMLEQERDRTEHTREALQRDNDNLKAAYTQLKRSYDELLQGYHEQKTQAEIALEAKASIERDHEYLYTQWREHLKVQAEEFQQLQADMVPSRELEVLRVQLMKELDYPHRQRIQAVTEEMSKFRDLYIRERRDHELAKTKLAQQQVEHDKQVADLTQRHGSVERDLQLMVQQLTAALESVGVVEPALAGASSGSGVPGGVSAAGFAAVTTVAARVSEVAARVRQSERDNAELTGRNRQLMVELEQIRRDLEEANTAKAGLELRLTREHNEWQAKIAAAERERQSAARRSSELSDQLEGARREAQLSDQNVVSARAELAALATQLADKTHELRATQERQDKRWQELQQLAETDRQRALAHVDDAKRQARDAQQQAAELQQKIAYLERENVAAVKMAREEEAKKTWDVERSRTLLQTQLSSLEKGIAEERAGHTGEIEALKAELESGRELIRNVSSERARLSDKLEQLQAAYAQVKQDHDNKLRDLKDMEADYQLLQRKAREHGEKESSLAMARDKADALILALRNELETVYREVEEARRAQQQQWQQQQDAWMAEIASYKERALAAETDLSSRESRLQADYVKCKQDKNKYKRMAAALKAQLAEAMQDAESGVRDKSVSLKAAQLELAAAKKQLREVERQRDELKLRLGYGVFGVGGGGLPASSATSMYPGSSTAVNAPSSAITGDPAVSSTSAPLGHLHGTVLADEQRTRQQIAEMRLRVESVASSGVITVPAVASANSRYTSSSTIPGAPHHADLSAAPATTHASDTTKASMKVSDFKGGSGSGILAPNVSRATLDPMLGRTDVQYKHVSSSYTRPPLGVRPQPTAVEQQSFLASVVDAATVKIIKPSTLAEESVSRSSTKDEPQPEPARPSVLPDGKSPSRGARPPVTAASRSPAWNVGSASTSAVVEHSSSVLAQSSSSLRAPSAAKQAQHRVSPSAASVTSAASRTSAAQGGAVKATHASSVLGSRDVRSGHVSTTPSGASAGRPSPSAQSVSAAAGAVPQSASGQSSAASTPAAHATMLRHAGAGSTSAPSAQPRDVEADPEYDYDDDFMQPSDSAPSASNQLSVGLPAAAAAGPRLPQVLAVSVEELEVNEDLQLDDDGDHDQEETLF